MYSRLKLLALATDADGALENYLDTLSNAQFRTTGDVIGGILQTLPDDDMWRVVVRLTRYNNRAFLGTMLKTLVVRLSSHFCEHGHHLREWACGMTAVDRHKTLISLVPVAATPQEVSLLLETFGQHDADLGHGHDMDYLLQAATVPAYFVLLGYMRVNEHDKALLTRICYRVMRRGDSVSFNAASLFKVFFDLQNVRGTFSLRIEPYELGRLETDYELFKSKISVSHL